MLQALWFTKKSTPHSHRPSVPCLGEVVAKIARPVAIGIRPRVPAPARAMRLARLPGSPERQSTDLERRAALE